MASRAVTALDQLNHIIDATFSSIRKFEPFDRKTTLQSLPGAYLGISRSVAYNQPLILPCPFINPSEKGSIAGTGKWVHA